MKNAIRKWLGMEYHAEAITDLRCRCNILEEKLKKCEDGGSIFVGESAKEDSLKEFVYGMAKYLKLRPRKTFKEVPSEHIATKTERVYEIIKVK
jgi:hypothetical protein